MWFCIPLQHGIVVFRDPRHPKSEENPIKNRAREQTPCNASFFRFLGPRGGHKDRKGSPKGAPRVPRRDPKTIKNLVFFIPFSGVLPKWVLGRSPKPRDPKSNENDTEKCQKISTELPPEFEKTSVKKSPYNELPCPTLEKNAMSY